MWGGIEGVLCLEEAVQVDAFEPSTFSIVIRGMRYSSCSRCVDLLVEDLPCNTRSWFSISPPYQAKV